MRSQNFGIEIEMTGITRSTAAKVIAGYFHTDATHVGGCYDAYSVRDDDGRMWKIMRDASVRCENRSGQNASSLYSVEFVTPICNYDDIETIQELVRKLRGAGARVNSSCGLHCHINAAPHTPKTLRNIVNIMAAKEDLLYKALKVNVSREHYCQKMDTRFLDEINNRPPMSMEQIKSMWYDGEDYSYVCLYSSNRPFNISTCSGNSSSSPYSSIISSITFNASSKREKNSMNSRKKLMVIPLSVVR